MILSEILDAKFPGKRNNGYEVYATVEDTNEHYIGRWNEQAMGRPKPSPEEVAGWEKEAAALVKKRDITRDAIENYKKVFSDLQLEDDDIAIGIAVELATNPGGPRSVLINEIKSKQERAHKKVEEMYYDVNVSADQISGTDLRSV